MVIFLRIGAIADNSTLRTWYVYNPEEFAIISLYVKNTNI